MVKVYLAGSWENRHKIRKMMDRIEKAGHIITTDWTWHDSDNPATLTDYANGDYLGVKRADVLVLDGETRSSGKMTEFGMAIAWNKPVILIGDISNIFKYIGVYAKAKDIDEVIDMLNEMKNEYDKNYGT